jgi:hypothetical protein
MREKLRLLGLHLSLTLFVKTMKSSSRLSVAGRSNFNSPTAKNLARSSAKKKSVSVRLAGETNRYDKKRH